MRLKRLVGKLNGTSHRALEAAVGRCASRKHFEVEPLHWWLELFETADSDVARLCRRFEVDRSRVIHDLSRAVEGLASGNTRSPSFAPSLPLLVSEAWLVASVDFGLGRIRSGHLLLATLDLPALRDRLLTVSPPLAGMVPATVRADYAASVAGSNESDELFAAERDLRHGPFRVFISYRRDDWMVAGRVSDALRRELGDEHVFRDIESIGVGVDWMTTLQQQLDSCSAVVAVIGPAWHADANVRRLRQDGDYVRFELARAFERQVQVIPLLVDSTAMPSAAMLPDDLAQLPTRQALHVTDATFSDTVARLASALKQLAALRSA